MSKNKDQEECIPFAFVINAINTMPIYKLKPVARLVCGTDYAVRFYDNPKHPKFYHKQDPFRKALRRCYTIGAFDHRETIVRMLELEEEYNDSEE